MSRNGGSRITFSNNNVPKVLGSVLSVLADSNLNIIDMVNKSRGEVAYNIIDIEGDISQAVKDSIAKVNGVMGVRVL
jgi:D-3-phosphoglycerate dehydrogenase